MTHQPLDNTLSLNNIAGIESFSSRFARLGDLYILSNIDLTDPSDNRTEIDLPRINTPLRIDGLFFLLIHKGKLELRVNTVNYHINSGEIFIARPGTLLTFTKVDRRSKFTLLFISSTLLHNINIDLSSIEFTSVLSHTTPGTRLNETETDVLRRYFDLLDINANNHSDSVYAARVARDLLSAMVYEILRFASFHEPELGNEDIEGKQSRATTYVFRFMELLQVNYAKERNLEFYARQLCITPKYLSMVTKEVTGYSASDWISRVVIIEAKNMMRLSGKNIQEVAYSLNFPSQSAFGKYFKRFTGQSPSDYIKN